MGSVCLNQFGIVEKFRQDEFIFHEGEFGEEMYIMLSGSADVFINSFDDMPVKVHEIAAGDFFGEMALLEDLPRSASIYASEDSVVLKIERDNFEKLIANRPDMAYKMMKVLSCRLRKTNEELANRKKIHKNEINREESIDNLGIRKVEEKEASQKYLEEGNERLCEEQNITENLLEKFQISSIFPKGHMAYKYVPYDDFYDSNVLSKSIVCPVCGDEFSADMVKNSKLQFSHEEKFFRKRYKNINPLVSMVWSCPRCFYSNYYYEFNTLNSYKLKGVKKAISVINYNYRVYNSQRDNINAIFLKYYIMLYIEEHSNPSPIKLAKIWLNLYWLYEDVGDEVMKKYAFDKTCEFYKYAYYKSNITLSKTEELRLGILVAELTGENGGMEESYRLLSKIIVDKKLSQILKNKVSTLMYEYKNKIKENNKM